MYRLGRSYKNYCVVLDHVTPRKKTDFNHSLGVTFFDYEKGTRHFCLPCILFGSLVLGFSVPSEDIPDSSSSDCTVMLTLPACWAQH